MNESGKLMFGFLIILFRTLIELTFWVMIIRIVVNSIKRRINHNYFKQNVIRTQQHNLSADTKVVYKDISKDILVRDFNTEDLDSFKNYFYKMFVEFEVAYNNLDYNAMKTLSTQQLYYNYYTGITLDLNVGNKRIISNIRKRNVILFETITTLAKQVVSLMIEISYINYTINKNGHIVKGSRNVPITEKFEVVFRKDYETKKIIKCPNCGATVTGSKCEFCRTAIKNAEFKIHSIKKIID